MKFSYNWLQDYIKEELPSAQELARILTHKAYEVESVEAVDGDFILDIDILPNRAADSLSHYGVAREVAALLNLSLVSPENSENDESSPVLTTKQMALFVEGGSKSPRWCRRALKSLVVDVEVGESPQWLKEKLAAVGQRSINNVVDITNFVMFETGQPVHAFDFDKIADAQVEGEGVGDDGEDFKHVTIRPAREGEKITLLDDEEYELDSTMLVIADDEKPLDVAGIKGGKASAIDENTNRVLLSVCNFHPTKIRQTSQQLGLRTDASKRFENDLSPRTCSVAMERLSHLIHVVAGGKASPDLIDVYPYPRNPYKVSLSVSDVNELLGSDVDEMFINDVLERFGFSYQWIDSPRKRVLEGIREYVGVPCVYGASVSFDAPKSFDCSSFASYLYINAGIAVPRDSADQYVYGEDIKMSDLEPGDLVFSNSGHGNIHYSSNTFMAGTPIPDGVDHVGLYLGKGEVIHATRYGEPSGVIVEKLKESSSFKSIVGTKKVPGADSRRCVVTVPHWRRDITVTADLVEEIGRVYGYDEISSVAPEIDVSTEVNEQTYTAEKLKDILVSMGFSEVQTYAFGGEGEIEIKNPIAEDKKYLRSSLKLGLQDALELNEKNIPLLGMEVVKIFEIGTVFDAEGERTVLGIAVLGEEAEEALKAGVAKIEDAFDISIDTTIEDGVAEISLEEIIEQGEVVGSYNDLTDIGVGDLQVKPISPYPYVLRDIAVWIPADTPEADLVEMIEGEAGALLVNLSQFDKYEKDDRVSYAYRLVFQAEDRSLTDEEVNEVMENVTNLLNEKFEVR